jgi:glucosyl-dolichyl phosphate glucuronosyltransferase
MLNISVILCTYNRCDTLRNALESICSTTLPTPIAWEILVVDNNSSDETRAVTAEFCNRFPDLVRYIFEPKQGKSNALNTGVAQANGEVLVFVDDDVTVESTWLSNLTYPLFNGDWIGSGGRVVRSWTKSPPSWLAAEGPYEKVAWPLVAFDLGSEPCELRVPPCGTNMAFRAEVFEAYGLFRTDLGPQTHVGIHCCDDYEFASRLLRSGKPLRYEPSAVVYHPVSEERLSKDYFLGWWFNFGRANARVNLESSIGRIPRQYTRLPQSLLRLTIRAVKWALSFTSQRKFFFKALTWEMAGVIFEDLSQFLPTRSPISIKESRAVVPRIK